MKYNIKLSLDSKSNVFLNTIYVYLNNNLLVAKINNNVKAKPK